MKTISFSFLVVILLASCTKQKDGAQYIPTAADTTTSASLSDLQKGKAIYESNCNRCHALYSPDAYSASQWKQIVPGMASKAKLSSSDEALVLKYVTRGK